MAEKIVKQSPDPRVSIGSFAGQIAIAAASTAAIGAAGNAFYEYFFDPEAYVAGQILERAALAFAFPFPFIIAGLCLVGEPIAYVLDRLCLDKLIVFGLAGAVAGAAFGVATASGLPRLWMAFAAYGGVSAMIYWTLRRRA
jgi:hypothetical protein